MLSFLLSLGKRVRITRMCFAPLFTPLHIQNARFAGSYEWHGTVTLRISQVYEMRKGVKVEIYILKQFKSNIIFNI